VTTLPLAVDLDGTLIAGDVLALGSVILARARPFTLCRAVLVGVRGRPAFKRAIAASAKLSMDTLPWRADVIAWLQAEKSKGRTLVLATAADGETAHRVAAHLTLFSEVFATAGAVNLKSHAKARALAARFPGGFAYVGDSAADLPVWRAARAIAIVHAKPRVLRAARALGKPIERVFE
jgi:phosphoserine phosphatase